MKEQIRKEYYRRVRLVTKSELNGSNKIEAINTLAVPVFTYSVNIVNWQMSEKRKLDTKTRKLLTMERMNHPKADVERMYLPREGGGRGLSQLELVFKTTTVGLHAYLEQTEDPLLKLVYRHEDSKKLYSVSKDARKFKGEFEVPDITRIQQERVTLFAKRVKQETKKKAHEKMRQIWEGKPMHGQYPTRVNKSDVQTEQTHKWIKSPGLKEKLRD